MALNNWLLPVCPVCPICPIFLVVLISIALSGCERGAPATQAECALIFDRLVELELQEMGYRDPVLLKLWQGRLAVRHEGLVSSCVGRRLPPGAMECVRRVASAEALSHECLDVGGAVW
jgi:hypothetical protein